MELLFWMEEKGLVNFRREREGREAKELNDWTIALIVVYLFMEKCGNKIV